VLEFEGHLFVDGENAWRKKPAQPEHVALFVVEGEVFVQERIREKVHTAGLATPNFADHDYLSDIVRETSRPDRPSGWLDVLAALSEAALVFNI
jgi:hypothetical protein